MVKKVKKSKDVGKPTTMIPKAKYDAKFGKVNKHEPTKEIQHRFIDADFTSITRGETFSNVKRAEVAGFHKNSGAEKGKSFDATKQHHIHLKGLPEPEVLRTHILNVNTKGYFKLSKKEQQDISYLTWSKIPRPFEKGYQHMLSGRYSGGDKSFPVKYGDALNKPFEPLVNAGKILNAKLKTY